MNTSQKTISHVRDILKKLDRSIDAARAKRLGKPEDSSPGAPAERAGGNGVGEIAGEERPQRARPIQRARPLDPSKRTI
jgi:hypothetical protein